jgi:hypothetical protein
MSVEEELLRVSEIVVRLCVSNESGLFNNFHQNSGHDKKTGWIYQER